MQIGFILAAGFGKRMGDLTERTPKPLLPVREVPLIYFALFQLYRWDIKACIINLHYLGDQIESELKNFPWFPLHFSRETSEILGTAGGLRQASSIVNEAVRTVGTPTGDNSIILLNPDTIIIPEPEDRPDPAWLNGAETCFNMKQKQAGSKEAGWEQAVGVPTTDNGDAYPIQASATGKYYYTGYSLIRPASVAHLPENTYAELGPIWREQGEAGRLRGRELRGKVVDAGTRASYDLIKNQEIIPPSMQDEWRTFLSKL